MFEKKFLGFIAVITIIGLVGGVYLVSDKGDQGDSQQIEMSSNTSVIVEETSHDWGNIGIDDGNVEKVFMIKNEGTDTLKLSNVTTSCMCTTAQLSVNDESSPVYGMHSKSSYVLEVPAGQTAELKVVFDPAFHGPSGVGPINRQVQVATNDESKPELNFMLTAMVRR